MFLGAYKIGFNNYPSCEMRNDYSQLFVQFLPLALQHIQFNELETVVWIGSALESLMVI